MIQKIGEGQNLEEMLQHYILMPGALIQCVLMIRKKKFSCKEIGIVSTIKRILPTLAYKYYDVIIRL